MKRYMPFVSGALIILACAAPALSRIVYIDRDKEAVELAAKAVDSAADKPAAFEALQDFINDPERKISARRYGMKRMRELAIKHEIFEVEEFFVKAARGGAPAGQLRAAAFLEYSKLQVYKEDAIDAQIGVLANLLKVNFQGKLMTHVRVWAANELCSRGADSHLEAVHDAFRFSRSSTSDDEMALCRAKIQLLKNQPDRVAALHEALEWPQPLSMLTKLHRWAISELVDSPGERPERILKHYVLEKLESNDPADYEKIHAAVVGLVERGWSANRLIEAGIPGPLAFSLGAQPE